MTTPHVEGGHESGDPALQGVDLGGEPGAASGELAGDVHLDVDSTGDSAWRRRVSGSGYAP